MDGEMGRDIETVETSGGVLVSVPADKKIYLVEDLPLNPFGVSATDLEAVAREKLKTVS